MYKMFSLTSYTSKSAGKHVNPLVTLPRHDTQPTLIPFHIIPPLQGDAATE